MNIKTSIWGYVGCLSLVACGSSGGAPSPTHSASMSPDKSTTDTSTSADAFAPPPVAAGYTRIVAPTLQGIEPGGDKLQCQYVLAPFDVDKDVLDIQGYQSKGGHHSIAYAIKNGAPVGTSRDCNTEDNTEIGGFLGGVGGEGGGTAKLPDGVVFRLAKGSSIMLNTHFLNTGTEVIDGQTVLDVKFDDVDTSRKVASMFVNVTLDFTLDPDAKSTTDATCTVGHDLPFLSFTNHMHSYGVSSQTELTRAGETAASMVHVDPTWTSDMQFNPVFTNWTVDAPFIVKAGDTLKTHCEWDNSTSKAIVFPDEMCVGFGFFLSDGSTSPLCLNGNWSE